MNVSFFFVTFKVNCSYLANEELVTAHGWSEKSRYFWSWLLNDNQTVVAIYGVNTLDKKDFDNETEGPDQTLEAMTTFS